MITETAQELEGRAGFQPLMHLLPSTAEADAEGWSISWSDYDEVLR